MNALPTIKWKNRVWTFDYRLQELRSITKKGIKTVFLNTTEVELLDHAIKSGDEWLVKCNMRELDYKGV